MATTTLVSILIGALVSGYYFSNLLMSFRKGTSRLKNFKPNPKNLLRFRSHFNINDLKSLLQKFPEHNTTYRQSASSDESVCMFETKCNGIHFGYFFPIYLIQIDANNIGLAIGVIPKAMQPAKNIFRAHGDFSRQMWAYLKEADALVAGQTSHLADEAEDQDQNFTGDGEGEDQFDDQGLDADESSQPQQQQQPEAPTSQPNSQTPDQNGELAAATPPPTPKMAEEQVAAEPEPPAPAAPPQAPVASSPAQQPPPAKTPESKKPESNTAPNTVPNTAPQPENAPAAVPGPSPEQMAKAKPAAEQPSQPAAPQAVPQATPAPAPQAVAEEVQPDPEKKTA